MKFCPRCGGLMIPAGREGDNVILRCTRCGYTETISAKQVTDYTIVGETPKEEHTITTLKVSEAKRRPAKTLEEWEQEREEYREVLQELLQQELEGTEE
ncbi:RNA polymerase [Hyperthermus butylicus]|uniref:RNA polymerase, subunit M n=1 Tax=Hyperthermus butylicus (strain DSM 5456 / JCM 9403 / PLM1-5) TaxID=415426 RepID=A2BJT9_HYPBU|nr:RNA polymerase [Hyperthermus butylicus]ABM80250.1 RNA polymerase, subunit M [Hyperthermus butylicus DSM 5456]